MNPLTPEQLKLNDKFIDLIEEYTEETSMADFNAKDLFKFIWHRDFMLRRKDHTIYE